LPFSGLQRPAGCFQWLNAEYGYIIQILRYSIFTLFLHYGYKKFRPLVF
jgi:hypothetical protein